MTTWNWAQDHIVLALHDEQISEHGGQAGLRDEGLLTSALARPVNRAHYENGNHASIAAAYAYGIAKNHPFFDGNKRTALVVCELFLVLNGYALNASDAECLTMFVSVADGSLSEQALTEWLLDNTHFVNGHF